MRKTKTFTVDQKKKKKKHKKTKASGIGNMGFALEVKFKRFGEKKAYSEENG
jgi:hypothetical protein